LPLPHISAIKYGFSYKADIKGKIIELRKTESIFDVYQYKNKLGKIKLNMPGEHNVLNSLAAIALSLQLEVPFEKIQNALQNFKGVERRFEFKGTYNGADIFDDYGHHPTEIKNTLTIAEKRVQKKLHVIFQPHRFSRTQKLWDDFVNIFADNKKIQTLYLADIYPASEAPIQGITSKKLAQAIKEKNPNIKIFYCSSYNQIQEKISNNLQQGDLLITVGAGKVNKIGEELVNLDI